MRPVSARSLVEAEAGRWSRDPGVLGAALCVAILAGLLTALAVLVAAGTLGGGDGGVQLTTDLALGADSTDDDLASLLSSGLVLLLPIGAIVVGTRFAGSEMSSGALVTVASVSRRMRLVVVVRAALLAAGLLLMAALATALVCLGSTIALSAAPDVDHLSSWSSAPSLLLGAGGLTLVLGLLAFALAALTRRWIAVLVGAIVYLVALEPVIQSLSGGRAPWLPRAATASLLSPDPAWDATIPTVVATAVLLTWAVLSLRRDHVFS